MTTLDPSDSIDRRRITRISKLLSSLLRHNAVKAKLNIRSDGYLAVSELLTYPKLKDVTMEEIEFVVRDNDKQRFHLLFQDDQWWIRANQGHSLELKDIALDRILDPPPVVIHGTKRSCWDLIKTTGLKTMGRQHIHFAPGLPGEGVKSGVRLSSEIFIYIDASKAMADGIVFYRSQNDVILSQGKDNTLAPIYFDRVVDKQGQLVEW
ncbi:phosphotransferase KptA/Tpt1 [Phycomyces nitens]|nr:phosphotransferase KptA/Tpt1 [Phycomyces nitens]